MVEISDSGNGSHHSHWVLCDRTYPRSEIVYLSQVTIIYIVVLFALVNITLGSGDNQYWYSALSAAVAYLLPRPTLRNG